MAIYEGDQQMVASVVVNGVLTPGTPAAVKASVANGATAYQFTTTYTYHHSASSQPLTFRRGVAYSLDAALKASLLAAGAPMVAL